MNKMKAVKSPIKRFGLLWAALILLALLLLSACGTEAESPSTEPSIVPQVTAPVADEQQPAAEPTVYGNTVGNIANGGFVAEYDGTLYYSLQTTGGDAPSGEIIMTDGSGEPVSVYSGPTPSCLNVIDGKLCFTGSGDKIYVLDLSDTSDMQAARLGDLGATKAMIMADGSLYCVSIGDDMVWRIYRLDIESGACDELAEAGQTTSGFAVGEDYIYYSCGDGGTWSTFRLSIDGGEPEKIADAQLYSPCLEGDKIYYLDAGEDGEAQIYSMNTDGSVINLLGEGIRASALNSDGEWLYYSIDGAIYKAKMDGSEQTMLCELPDSYKVSINIVDGQLYALNQDENLYCVSTDGGELQELS